MLQLRWKLRYLASALLFFGMVTVIPKTQATLPTPGAKPNMGAIPIPPKKPHIETAGQLSVEDKNTYHRIFTLQENGDIKAANKAIKKINDDILIGYVQSQRYLGPHYTSSKTELIAWLKQYSDHPQAHKIHKLAIKKGAKNLRKPSAKITLNRIPEPAMVPSLMYTTSNENSHQNKTLTKDINRLLRQGNPAAAYKLAQSDDRWHGFDHIQQDILRSRIAASFLYEGQIKNASTLAQQAVNRSRLHVPLGGWIAGLTAWKARDYKSAAHYFEITARSQYASGWTRAAGAYWAARAHNQAGDKTKMQQWLTRAATYPRTFYGLLAARAAGQNFAFNLQTPSFEQDQVKTLAATPGGKRALALFELGEIAKADAEILHLKNKNETFRNASMAFAAQANLPLSSMRIASHMSRGNKNTFTAALYPETPWQPKGGYTVDPALINAIIRQESRFDPNGQSKSGAKGLMQIMPTTAAEVAGYKNPNLLDPQTNLQLGQKYIADLLKTDRVDGELIALLIAYNAGQGNLGRWQAQWARVNDPLLFIELIPLAETRAYVERVLANYWIYQMLDGRGLPSMNALITGKSPIYAYNEKAEFKTASN